MVSRRGPNGQIVQSVPYGKKRTKKEKESSGIFGDASGLSKLIREDLRAVYGPYADGRMVNRMTTENRAVLDHGFDRETKTYHFIENSFERLQGFEFNMKSPLINSLWLRPELTLQDGQVLVSLPELTPGTQLVFPSDTDFCTLRITVAMFALFAGFEWYPAYLEVEVEKRQDTIPAQQWVFDLPEGCLCTAALGLSFYVSKGNVRTVYSHAGFHPAGIFGAVFRPGDFPEPDLRYWQPMHLKLA